MVDYSLKNFDSILIQNPEVKDVEKHITKAGRTLLLPVVGSLVGASKMRTRYYDAG